MQDDKLGYLLANLVYHIMVQAHKANLGLLVLSGAGFGHHLLFSGELTPKLYILHVVAVQRTTYVLCVLQGSSTNVISNNMVSTNAIFQLHVL